MKASTNITYIHKAWPQPCQGLSSCGRDIECLKSSYGQWSPLGIRSVRSAHGVAVLLEEIDEDDEIVWLSEVKVEGSDERLPRCVEGTTVCVDVSDREEDSDEQDGVGRW